MILWNRTWLGLFIAFAPVLARAESAPSTTLGPSGNNSFYLEHTHYNEVRKLPGGDRVFYDVESLYFKHINHPYHFATNFNFSLKRDFLNFTKQTKDLDLLYIHAANLQKKDIFGKLDISAGRMLASRPTGNRLFDGAEVLFRDPHVSVLAWAGVDRRLDVEDFKDSLYTSGFSLYFPRVYYFDTFVGYKVSTSQEDVGLGHFLSSGFEWSGPLDSRLYIRSVFEGEVAEKRLDSGRGEIDYSLTDKTAARLFTSYYKRDSLRGTFEESLLSVFSVDRVWENSASITQVIGKYHEVTPTYAVSVNQAPGDSERLAHTLSFIYRGTYFENYTVLADYRYMNTHQGFYHLLHGELMQTYNRFFSLTEKAYWATYSKITGADNRLSFFSLGIILNSLNRWNLLMEVGNSSNSRMSYDIMGRLAFQYKFWK